MKRRFFDSCPPPGSAAVLLLAFTVCVTALPDAAAASGLECVAPSAVGDAGGNVHRNETSLASPDLCLRVDEFAEASLRWRLLVIRNMTALETVFWFVPHDNETAAFDSAVHGVRTYGGTVVAVLSGGHRLNGPQDPNRNFDLGTGPLCPEQRARSPRYTAEVMRDWDGSAPILALHTNERGYEGDGHGGRGTISIARPAPGIIAFRAHAPLGASPDDTIAYVASLLPPAEDTGLMRFVSALMHRGINVAYETVSPGRNDCSLSNYAAITSIPRYVNIEVVNGDRSTQRRMIGIVLSELGIHRLGSENSN